MTPLAPEQEGLWFQSQLAPMSTVSNQLLVARFEGVLDEGILEQALRDVIAHQDALRSSFALDVEHDGRPSRVVHADVPLALQTLDLRGCDAAELDRRAAAWWTTHLDPARPPLFRIALARTRDAESVMLVVVHHLVWDGWSSTVFLRDLAAAYRARRENGSAPALTPLAFRYDDHAVAQRERRASALEDGITDVLQRLEDAHALELFPDGEREGGPSASTTHERFVVDAYVAGRLRELAARIRATSFHVVLAALGILFARTTGKRRLIVAIPSSTRRGTAAAKLIGCFATTVPVVIDLSGDPTFEDLVARVRLATLEGLKHVDLTYGDVVDAARRAGREDMLPPRPAMTFTLVPGDFSGVDFGDGLRAVQAPAPTGTVDVESIAQLAILMVDSKDAGTFVGALLADAGVFGERSTKRIAERLVVVLDAVSRAPSTTVFAVPIMSAAERDELEKAAYGASLPNEHPTLHDLVARAAECSPSATAVVTDTGVGALTYRELMERAGSVAAWLHRRGVRRGSRVAVSLGRSADMITGVLGVLRAGGAYVPIDPSFPDARRKLVREDAACVVELDDDSLREALDECAGVSAPRVETSSSDVAYVLYTSGSTGRPKGVMVTHGSIVAFLRAMQRHPGIARDDVIVAVTTLSFDIAALELFLPLSASARVVVASRDTAADPRALAKVLADTGATMMQATPVTWRMLLDEGWRPPRGFRVLCGGEALPPKLAADLAATAARVFNMYGPTETTVWSTCAAVERDAPVTIGRPIDGTTVRVLDRDGEPTPVGVPGELFIGGQGVALGYHGRPDLTADRFVPDPFAELAGARMYRTGDFARIRPDGLLECLGRLDHQVKVRGFRIELGEIDAALSTCDGVRAAVAIAHADASGERTLVAYVTPRTVDLDAVKRALAERIPDYMIPSALVALDALPLTPNGKVDRKGLPAPHVTARETEHCPPRTALEQSVARIFEEVLRAERIGIHDDFFSLGGHSLRATQVASRIRSALGVDAPVRLVFEARTVARLSEALASLERRSDVPLERIDRSRRIVASFAQTRLWFVEQLDSSAAYNIPINLRIEGDVDEQAMVRAFATLVQRHEALRTTFEDVDGEPMQSIAGGPTLEIVSASDIAGARQIVETDAQTPFDLAKGPVARAKLVRSEGLTLLSFVIHHIAIDGWSIDVLLRELATLYTAFTRGEDPALASQPFDYADFAVWQKKWLTSDTLDRQLAFWKQHLAGAPPTLELPTDHPRPKVARHRGASLAVEISAQTVARLEDLCLREGVTPFMVVLTAYQTVLAWWSRQTDVIVGTTIANRTRTELEPIVGLFANTLALRTRFERGSTFREALSQVKATAHAAYSNQDLPFENVLETLDIQRDQGSASLFRAFLVLQAVGAGDAARPTFGDLRVTPEPLANTPAKFDLYLDLIRADRRLYGTFTYDADLWEADTANRFLQHLLATLDRAVEDPSVLVFELPRLGEDERHTIVSEWNRTSCDWNAPLLLAESIAAQATRDPKSIAIEQGDERLSYAELDAISERVAVGLLERGVSSGTIVASCVERSPDALATLLAILKIGAVYLPIDPDYPPTRIAAMLEDARPAVIVGRSSTVAELAAATGDRRHRPPTPDMPAYMIFTSGSTGTPKAAITTHRGLTNVVRSHQAILGLKPGDRVLARGSLSFDASVLEMLWPLSVGATVVLAEGDGGGDPAYLVRTTREKSITTIDFPPSLLGSFLAEDGVEDCTSLRFVTSGGEALPLETVRRFGERLPGASLHNTYGPTEAAIVVTIGPCEASDGDVSIGRPLPNTTAYVLDDRMNPVPVGVQGELYLGGANVGLGYHARPEITAERFVPDPFAITPGARLYRTGDLAWFGRDGALHYAGRVDTQVKLRGYRIELGDIEAALLDGALVRDAVVIVRGQGEDARLVAYVVLDGADVPTVKAKVGSCLPAHMQPQSYVALAALPLTPNGKVDRRALPVPPSSSPVRFVPATTPVEKLLTATFARVLGREQISAIDDFFELGGHSLLAMKVIAALRAELAVRIRVRDFFAHPTVVKLAALVERERNRDEAEPPPILRRGDEVEPVSSFVQDAIASWERGRTPSATTILHAAIVIAGLIDIDALKAAIDDVLRRQDSLRTRVDVRSARITSLRISPASEVDVAVVDGPGERVLEEARAPFALNGEVPVRIRIVRVADDRVLVFLAVHPILTDPDGLDSFARELAGGYERLVAGAQPTADGPAVRYSDYARWEREWFADGGAVRVERARRRLAGVKPVDLPTDRPRHGVPSADASETVAQLSASELAALQAGCRASSVTPYVLFLVSTATVLRAWTGATVIPIGAPTTTRSRRPELEGMIGRCFNIMTTIVDVGGDPPVAELLARVRGAALDALEVRDVPAGLALDTESPIDCPLNRVVLNGPNFVTPSRPFVDVPGLRITREHFAAREGARNELTISGYAMNDEMRLSMRAAKTLYDETTTARLMVAFREVLLACEPHARLSDLLRRCRL